MTNTFNKSEMANRIYDTLFFNIQHPPFPINDVIYQTVDAEKGIINIEFEDCFFEVKIIRRSK